MQSGPVQSGAAQSGGFQVPAGAATTTGAPATSESLAPGMSLLSNSLALPAPAPAPAPALDMEAGSAAFAEHHPVVIELYTSQGCSSCPPADALMAELVNRPDVIALALHVDYWDYIGWTDSFADAAFTKRQKAYARAVGSRTIYTPQMIVEGQEHLVGLRPMELAELIRSHSDLPSNVRFSFTREGNTVRIRIEAQPPLSQTAVVQIVRYRPEETVTIEHGENAGKTIRYNNIVTEWQPVAEWDGQRPLDMRAELSGSDPAVVIVQQKGPGPILAADLLP